MKRETKSRRQEEARADLEAYLDELVATAPTITPEQRDAIRAALRDLFSRPAAGGPPVEDATPRPR